MDGALLYNKYREYFLSFLARTTQKNRILEHLEDRLPELNLSDQNMRILDIGAGTGKISIPLIAKLGGNVKLVAQEPNIGMAVNLFFNYLVEDLPFQNLELNNLDSVEYEPEQFDLILASHVFYYLPNWEQSLQAIYDALAPGGSACIIMNSKEGNLYKLRNEIFPMIYGRSACSAETLLGYTNKLGLPHEVFTLDSLLDLSQANNSNTANLREHGIIDASRNSMLSFLLRTDFQKLPESMQEQIEGFICANSEGKYILLRDKAIWLRKPGMNNSRQSSIGQNINLRLEDYTNLFIRHLDDSFGEELSFLSPAMKRAYYSMLSLDSVLSHPTGRISIMNDENSLITQDDDPRPIPIPGKRINDFVVYDPRQIKLKNTPCYQDENLYPMIYTHSGDTLTYLVDHIKQEYDFLPEYDKSEVPKREFFWLILNIANRFKHFQVFSNRHDGSTLLGVLLNQDSYLDWERMKNPEQLTDKLAGYYEKIGVINLKSAANI